MAAAASLAILLGKQKRIKHKNENKNRGSNNFPATNRWNASVRPDQIAISADMPAGYRLQTIVGSGGNVGLQILTLDRFFQFFLCRIENLKPLLSQVAFGFA